ncbi:DUF887 domain-containing protein [Paracoccidioides lutzii Pb01]|uniref:DUF887 domain-containing protein n=1 Tax=Paracoccidioides lutzii (strain ATCC MYA-826 / Pb01) TaxID=502779 RepID=C1GTU2_PARBA|nr:DUF887 domain-containing protein [Paracoccidioides lutzii Pb01]EEH39748.1 DUF887 domain-containing protein [Paracoccidioides lutzii Pb01]
MLDPLPPSPQWLQDAFRPMSEKLGLHSMPLHIHEIIFSFVGYQLIQSIVSPYLSTILFPKLYPHFSHRTKLNWDVHVVSLVQSSLINAVALWVMFVDEDRQSLNSSERVWGYLGSCGLIQSMAVGYFIWDLIVSTRYMKIFGIGLWFHAVSALWVFCLGFRPFVNYYGPTFILYELSSPFLNFHWFFDKVNMTGSKVQWYNGMALLSMFFCCRLVWGTWQSTRVFMDIFSAYKQADGRSALAPVNVLSFFQDRSSIPCATETCTMANAEISKFADAQNISGIPIWLIATYLGSNLILNSLNFYWFWKMIETVMKRFRVPAPDAQEKTKTEESKIKIKLGAPNSHAIVLEAAAKLEQEERLFINGGISDYTEDETVTVSSSTATTTTPSARRRKA